MKTRLLSFGLVAAFGLSTIGCKLKLEGKVTGFKEGSSDTVLVHVVSEKGADITCTPCKPGTKVPDTGELDVEVPLSADGTKLLFINGKKGLKKGSTMIDLAGSTPAKLAVAPTSGLISCAPRECSGSIDLAPSPRIFLKTQPGTILQLGKDKLIADEHGAISGPISLDMSPPLEKQRLDKICYSANDDDYAETVATAQMGIMFPDKASASTKATLQLNAVEKSFASHLEEVEKGPVHFPWEKPGTPARGKRAAVFVYAHDCYDAGAKDATVADLDVIAVAENKTRTGECSYRSASSTATGKMTMYDLQATVYDRITGKKLATKLFPAPKDCLDTFSAPRGTTTAPDSISFVDKEGVAKWAAMFAR